MQTGGPGVNFCAYLFHNFKRESPVDNNGLKWSIFKKSQEASIFNFDHKRPNSPPLQPPVLLREDIQITVKGAEIAVKVDELAFWKGKNWTHLCH